MKRKQSSTSVSVSTPVAKKPKVPVRYSGAVITNIQDPKQNKHIQKKTVQSNFHLIVNTNKHHNAESEELLIEARKLKAVADYILHGDHLGDYVEFVQQDGRSINPEGKWDHPDPIKKVDTACGIERGELHDQPHAHMGVFITHTTRLRLALAKIRALYQERMGYTCYVHVQTHRAAKDPQQVILDYMAKNNRTPFDPDNNS